MVKGIREDRVISLEPGLPLTVEAKCPVELQDYEQLSVRLSRVGELDAPGTEEVLGKDGQANLLAPHAECELSLWLIGGGGNAPIDGPGTRLVLNLAPGEADARASLEFAVEELEEARRVARESRFQSFFGGGVIVR